MEPSHYHHLSAFILRTAVSGLSVSMRAFLRMRLTLALWAAPVCPEATLCRVRFA